MKRLLWENSVKKINLFAQNQVMRNQTGKKTNEQERKSQPKLRRNKKIEARNWNVQHKIHKVF